MVIGRPCIKLHQDLLETYRNDFHKYGGKIDAALLAKIMLSISKQLGNKFIYSRVEPSVNMIEIKKALTMLSQAKVCTKILHTSGNGLPLGAESKGNPVPVIRSATVLLAKNRRKTGRD